MKFNTNCWVVMRNKVAIILASAGISVIFGAKSFAVEDDSSVNVIRYYAPSTCQISDSTNRATFLKNKRTDDSPLAEWVSQNYAAVTSLAAEYGLPWEPIMAQGAIESNLGTSDDFVQRNNIFILGPDGNGLGKDASYPDIETSWRALFEYLRLKGGASRTKIFSEDAVRNPSLYIEAITEAGYKPALPQGESYKELLEDLTAEIDLIVERANLQTAKEFLDNTRAMMGNIERNRGEGINDFGNALEYPSSECNCGGDASASGVRWSGFWVTNNSLYGSQKAPVVGMDAEKKVAAKDYGLNLQQKQLAINFRIKSETDVMNGDPYAAYPNGDYPHFLVDFKKKRVFQYFPIDLSAATKSSGNIEKGIVIDLVGYTDAGSNYYLWNEERNTGSEWKYLATLVNAIYEESGSDFVSPKEGDGAQIWAKLADYLNLTEHRAAVKCAAQEDLGEEAKEYEAQRFVNYYNKTVSIDRYALPLNSKSMPASFVAYFVARFTSLETDNLAWGEPRVVVKNLTAKYPKLESGSDPAPFAVFSSTNSSVFCGDFSCGSTGVIFSINNGLAITVEQSYPTGKAEIKKRSLADLKNEKYGNSFVYLRSVIDEDELKLGKMGQ